MSQIYKNPISNVPGGDVETLSSEGGPATAPTLADNFNFSGSIAGGSAANGAIRFITPGGPGAATNGQMDADVLVDGTTIHINGSNQLEVISSGLTYYSLTPYIVGPDIHSQYSTIGAAITAAVTAGASSTSPASILIKPKSGGYTEDISLSDGIALFSAAGGSENASPTIIGKISYSGAGTVSISNLILQTNSDYFLQVTGSSASIVNINNCYLNCTNNTGINYTSSSANSQIRIRNCRGDLATTGIALFSSSSAGTFSYQYTNLANSGGSTTPNTISAGNLSMFFSAISNGITTSGTSSIGNITHTNFNVSAINATALTIGGSGSNFVLNSFLNTGTASSLSASSTVTISNILFNSTNTNVLTGAGTVKYAFLSFLGSSSGQNVTTFTPLATLI